MGWRSTGKLMATDSIGNIRHQEIPIDGYSSQYSIVWLERIKLVKVLYRKASFIFYIHSSVHSQLYSYCTFFPFSVFLDHISAASAIFEYDVKTCALTFKYEYQFGQYTIVLYSYVLYKITWRLQVGLSVSWLLQCKNFTWFTIQALSMCSGIANLAKGSMWLLAYLPWPF